MAGDEWHVAGGEGGSATRRYGTATLSVAGTGAGGAPVEVEEEDGERYVILIQFSTRVNCRSDRVMYEAGSGTRTVPELVLVPYSSAVFGWFSFLRAQSPLLTYIYLPNTHHSCPACLESSRIESPLTRSSAPATAYIIPRPGPAHHVVLGGTYLPHDHSTQPCLSEAQRILKACYDLEPLLVGKDGTSWRDIEVVSHNVGLRPAREGGVRLELEERTIGQSGSGDTEGGAGLTPPTNDLRGRKVGVVHAYGFGSVG